MNRNRFKKVKERNNRINIIAAVVFLLMFALTYQLYKLQVLENEYFLAQALSQHNVQSNLSPNRGDIYIKDRGVSGEDLYPMATNKDFALVYAIPKDVEDPLPLAEKLYTFFDKERIEEEVEKYFKDKDERTLRQRLDDIPEDVSREERVSRANTIIDNFEKEQESREWQERRDERIKEKVEIREGEAMDRYIGILERENDAYRVLERKMEKEDLLKLYDFLWPDDLEKNFDYHDLFIRNGLVYYNDGNRDRRIVLEGISHVINNLRYYPEEEDGSHFLGFVNFYDEQNKRGNYGLEGFFDRILTGQQGYITLDSDSKDDETIVINNKNYKKPIDGDDLILSIDRSIQFFVCQQLREAVKRHRADSGSVVAVNPSTGEIIAMCSDPGFDPNQYNKVEDINDYNNPVVFADYEPGSVFKSITMASALNEGVITPHTTYEDEGKIEVDDWTIRNSDFSSHGPHGSVDMNYALAQSLNTGSIFAMERMGVETFADYVEKFGFGGRTGIELEGESRGSLQNLSRDRVPRIYGATASYGQGISVTPLQLVMAFSAIANEGVLMKPHIVKEILKSDGGKREVDPVRIRRVISEEAAALASGMMVNVLEQGHASGARVDGYYVGGKTGTAQVADSGGYGDRTIHNFVGSAPMENPKFTMLVRLDDPKDVRYAASSAAPLFGTLADFILNYYQVPKER